MVLTPSQYAAAGRLIGRGVRGLRGRKGFLGMHRRRVKRIVFSERQWEFVRSLINLSSRGRGVPHFSRYGGGRRHHKFRW